MAYKNIGLFADDISLFDIVDNDIIAPSMSFTKDLEQIKKLVQILGWFSAVKKQGYACCPILLNLFNKMCLYQQVNWHACALDISR